MHYNEKEALIKVNVLNIYKKIIWQKKAVSARGQLSYYIN